MARGTDIGAVAVPWRPHPERRIAFKFVERWWNYWGYDVHTADSNPDLPFSLSEARNNAVKLATSKMGGGVIIVADADTVPERMVISKAVQICNTPGNVVYPFNEYRYLQPSAAFLSDEGLLDDPDLPLKDFTPIWTKPNSVGGIIVTDTETYWELGGMDEKFERTWGFEDNAFYAVADTLAKVTRLDGTVYSFGHNDIERDWSSKNANYWRNQLYQMCCGKPELMKELLK